MPELYGFLNPMPFEAAVQMEKDLAEDLRADGYTVTGGTGISISWYPVFCWRFSAMGDDSVEVSIEEDPPGTGEQHWKLLCMHFFKLSAANLPSEQR